MAYSPHLLSSLLTDIHPYKIHAMTQTFQHALPVPPKNPFFSKIDIAACIYLLFPLILFICGWLQIWVSLPLASLIVYSFFRLYSSSYSYSIKQYINYKEIIPTLTIFLSYIFLTGITGNWAQHSDFYVRNDIFWDLTSKPWPPELPDGKYFIYYFQSYLPAALFGGMFGWHAAGWIQYIWSCIGILFTIYYLYKAVGKCSFWIACIFFLWNGLEFLPCTQASYFFENTYSSKIAAYTHLSEPPMFSLKALMHCFIPISIVGGMLIQPYLAKKLGPALGILSVMYNPMGSIFLLPILVYIYFRVFFTDKNDFYNKDKWRIFFKTTFSLHNISLFLSFILLIFPFYIKSESVSQSNLLDKLTFTHLGLFTYYLFFNIIIVTCLIRKNIKDNLLWIVLGAHTLAIASGILLNPDIAKKGSFITTYFFVILYCQAFSKEKSSFKLTYILYSLLAALYCIRMTGAFACALAGIGAWLLLNYKKRYTIPSATILLLIFILFISHKPQHLETVISKLSGEEVKLNKRMGIYQPDGGDGLWWWYKAFPNATTMPIWFKR